MSTVAVQGRRFDRAQAGTSGLPDIIR